MDPKTQKIEEFPKKNDGVGQKLTLFLNAKCQLFSSAADRSDLGWPGGSSVGALSLE